MGDEEFTKEELEILGESEEEGQETPDTSEDKGESQEESETEQTTETEEEETEETEQAEEEENKVPQSRVDQIVREREDLKRKNDLLRRDPQAYYEKYPDEKPEEQETEATATTFADAAHMRVQGGTYDGKTLAEVHDADPFAAMAIYNYYLDTQRETQRKTAETQDRLKRESEQEVNTFTENISKQMFSKEKDKLTDKETKEVDTYINGILDWMEETGRATTMRDAEILMQHEDILKAAQVDTVKGLIAALNSGTVSTVKAQKGTGDDSGYGKFMEYNVDEFAAYIDGLNDVAFKKFVKDAPQKLKDKFPQAAWE